MYMYGGINVYVNTVCMQRLGFKYCLNHLYVCMNICMYVLYICVWVYWGDGNKFMYVCMYVCMYVP